MEYIFLVNYIFLNIISPLNEENMRFVYGKSLMFFLHGNKIKIKYNEIKRISKSIMALHLATNY